MAIALVAKRIDASTDGEGYVSGSINTTGADFLVVAIANYPGAGGDDTFTDSKGNSWNALTSYTNGGLLKISTWYSIPTSVGSGHTITLSTVTIKAYPASAFRAYSGVLQIAPLDTQNGNNAITAATSGSTGSITTSASGNLALAAIAQTSAGETGYSINSSFTNLDSLGGAAAAAVGLAIADKIGGLSGSENPTFSWTGSTDASASISDFKAAAGGGSVVGSYYYEKVAGHI